MAEENTKKVRTSAKLFVGFSTKLVPGYEDMMPEFQASSVTKDPVKIKQQIAEKKEAFLANAAGVPYLASLAEVAISDEKNQLPRTWTTAVEAKKGRTVAQSVGEYLLRAYPEAWPWDIGARADIPVVVIGFNPRLFLKLLGLECSMPGSNIKLPPKLWYSNSDHRDIETAIIPTEFEKNLGLLQVMKRRRPIDTAKETPGKTWDNYLASWSGPGVTPATDVYFATELAGQLGFIDE